MNKKTFYRVGAICDADGEEVRLFGYGQYVGEEVPPPEVKMFGIPMTMKNPKIVLDDGKVVWGCECWWGDEAKVKHSIGTRRVKMVDIEKTRAESQTSHEP